MSTICRTAFVRWFLLPLTLVSWLGITSCTHWSEPKSPVESVIADKHPSKIRVTRADSSVTELQEPRIESDTLIGFGFPGEKVGAAQQMKIPLTDVKRVEVRSASTAATVLVVTGVTLLVVGAIAAATYDPEPMFECDQGQPSCPFVYSWDGETWRLDSGTFGGAFLEPLARTDIDNLMFAQAEDGIVRLRVANGLPETDHVDALRLLAVDHAPGTQVVPDGRGTSVLHIVGPLASPVSARDDRGRDALQAVNTVDGWGWESSPTGRDTTVAADVRDGLELEFRRPTGAREATLVVDGSNTHWAAGLMLQFVALHGRETDAWYAAMNADANAARALGARLAREAFLTVSVQTERGWEPQALVWESGPEIVKRQAVTLDLSAVEGEIVRVRLESVPLFWNLDRVGIDFSLATVAGSEAAVHDLGPVSAQMEGDGRDVREILTAADGVDLVLERGEAAELSFRVPSVPDGRNRSYLLASTGWYRIRPPASDAEPSAVVTRLEREGEPGALSRLAVARLNQALDLLAGGAPLVPAACTVGGR